MATVARDKKQHSKDAITLSEALEKTGFGVFNYVLILLGGLLLICTFFETGLIGFILPVAECDLKMTNQEKGILSAVGYAGIISSAHLWGFLADTKGRRAVIMPTVLISSIVSIVSSFSHRFWLLVVLRFLNGFFISGSSATLYAYIGEFHIPRTRTRAVLASSCILSVGAMLLPIIAWATINQSWSLPLTFLGIVYKPWRLFIVTCACPGFISGLILLFFPESPKFLASIGKNEEALNVLRTMHRWNVKDEHFDISEIIPEENKIFETINEASSKNSSLLSTFFRTMWNQTAPLFRKGLLVPTVLACFIQFWLYVTIHGMFMWFPFIVHNMVEFKKHNPGNSSTLCEVIHAKQIHLDNEFQIDKNANQCTENLETETFLLTILMEFTYGMGFFVIGFLVQRVKKTHILFFVLLTFGSCGLLTNVIYDTTWALVAYNMLFIAGIGIQVLSEITVDLYPTYLRAMALCISLMFGRLGGVFGANMIAWLLETSCEMAFNIAGTGLVVSAFLTFLIPKVEIPKRKQVTES